MQPAGKTVILQIVGRNYEQCLETGGLADVVNVFKQHLRPEHNVADPKIADPGEAVLRILVDDKHIPLGDGVMLRAYGMLRTALQHDDQFRKVLMTVQIALGIMVAVLNEKREVFRFCKDPQRQTYHVSPPSGCMLLL